MSKVTINTIGKIPTSPVKVDSTIRILDCYDDGDVYIDGRRMAAVNLNILDDLFKNAGGILDVVSRVDCDIILIQPELVMGQGSYTDMLCTNGALASYPLQYDPFLGEPTVGGTTTDTAMPEIVSIDYDRDRQEIITYNPIPLFRNGVRQTHIAYFSQDSEEYRSTQNYSGIFSYNIVDLSGNVLFYGEITVDKRAKAYVPVDNTINYSFAVENYLSEDKYTEYVGGYVSGNYNRTFYTFGQYETQQDFSRQSVPLSNGNLVALTYRKEAYPSQMQSLLGKSWSCGILLNYIASSSPYFPPTTATLKEYYINIMIYDELGNFIKGDRLRPNTNVYEVLDSNKNVVSSQSAPYNYLRIYLDNGDFANSFPIKRDFNNIDKLNEVFIPKGSFRLSPQAHNCVTKMTFVAKCQLHNQRFTTQEITLQSSCEILTKKTWSGTTNSFRRVTDKHFVFSPGATRDYELILNTNKSAETEIALQYASGQLLMDGYHGNMSRKPLINIRSFSSVSGGFYVYGKEKNRVYSQFAKALLTI